MTSAIKTTSVTVQKNRQHKLRKTAITNMLRLKIFNSISDRESISYSDLRYMYDRVSGYVLRQHLTILIRAKFISYDKATDRYTEI